MGVFVFQHDKVSDQKQDKKQILLVYGQTIVRICL